MLDFSILNNIDITVKSLNVYGNPTPILPPDVYHCRKGMRLYSRFFYIISGEMVFDKGTDRELRAASGDVLYLPADVEYDSEWTGDTPGSFLTVNFNINEPPLLFSDNICIAVHDVTGKYLHTFRKLHDIWTKGAFNLHLRALSLFTGLLGDISDKASVEKLADSFSDILQGIMYIEQNFCNDFSVDDLCRICNVSPATFRRKFKKYSPLSPITYRNFLRCKRAGELLESGEYTVTEAAMSVGFEDLSYFNRAFVRFFGSNPSDVKKERKATVRNSLV